MELFSTLAGLFGELIAPTGCAACDTPVGPATLFCSGCAVTVERSRATIGKVRAAFEHGGALAKAIARLKYEDRPDLAGRLARAMLACLTTFEGPFDRVVPVPLHPRRLADRGYNQAALLGRPIARALQVPFDTRTLVRLENTKTQLSLDRTARALNVRRAFGTRTRIEGARVLLVDDVTTTGATLEACTEALHEAGARSTHAIVLAQRP